MKKLFVVLIALLLATASVQAVSISITATNKGSSVSVSHYYSAVGDANYNAEGKGKVSFGSVDVSESFNFKGDVKREGRNFAKATHLISGENYDIESNHYLDGNSGTGSISESGSINAGDEGKMSKSVSDDVVSQGGSVAESFITVSNGNDVAGTYYELYHRKLSGSQSVSTGSASASQNVNGEGYDAYTYAEKYENDQLVEGAGSGVYVDGSATASQSANTASSASTSQSFSSSGTISFASYAAKDTDNDSNINEFATAGTHYVDEFNGMHPSGGWYDIYSESLNASTSATTSSPSASMNVDMKNGNIDDHWLGLTTAKDTGNDGTIDRRTDAYVEGDFTQFNASGYANIANEESYMEGYGNPVSGLTGYAHAEVDGSSSDDNVNINGNFDLKAWIENDNPYAEANP